MKSLKKLLLLTVPFVFSTAIFAAETITKPYYQSVLPPGARIVPGAPGKNEFFILAANEEMAPTKRHEEKTVQVAENHSQQVTTPVIEKKIDAHTIDETIPKLKFALKQVTKQPEPKPITPKIFTAFHAKSSPKKVALLKQVPHRATSMFVKRPHKYITVKRVALKSHGFPQSKHAVVEKKYAHVSWHGRKFVVKPFVPRSYSAIKQPKQHYASR